MKTISEMTDRELLEYLAGEVRNINLTIENEINPNIHALAEGHAAILEKLGALTPKSRVEELEDKVSMLQLAIRGMARDLEDLKKAQ